MSARVEVALTILVCLVTYAVLVAAAGYSLRTLP